MMEGVGGVNYVLVPKDDFSGYDWLVPKTEANAKTKAKSLLLWLASFGVVQTLKFRTAVHISRMTS